MLLSWGKMKKILLQLGMCMPNNKNRYIYEALIQISLYESRNKVNIHIIHLIVLISLQSLLTDEQVANAPCLVLGNKIDKAGAASEDEIRHWFGLHGQTTGRVSLFRYCFCQLKIHHITNIL